MKRHGIVLFAILSISMLGCGSCDSEPGNWTVVNQIGNYIYGVWKGPTVKVASQAMREIAVNIGAQGDRPSALATQTTLAPESLLPIKVSAGRGATASDWIQSRTPSTYHNTQTLYHDRAVKPDIYYAYGFKRQAEVEYQASRFGAKPLILLEIFDMGTPENAFGIYSFNTYPQAKIEWVGSKALLSGGYLRFSKSKYFIQIEGYEFATGIREGMIALAKVVASQIKEPPTKVPLLALLPSHRINGSEKLFRTIWTLDQIYNGLPSHLPQFTDKRLPALREVDTAALHNERSNNTAEWASSELPTEIAMEISAETPIGVSARYHAKGTTNWLDAPIVFIIRFSDASTAESVYALYRNAVTEKTSSIKIGEDGEILIDETSRL